MEKKQDTGEITRQLDTIAALTKTYQRTASQLNWQLARSMAAFQEKYGRHAADQLVELLRSSTDDNDGGGSSESKLKKMIIIGHFSPQDLVRMGIPDVDPFVFLQHKSAFVEHSSKRMINTAEAKTVLSALRDGASDFELRKLRKKGTKY